MRLVGKSPSNKNPNLCNVCDTLARTQRGGAEIELSMLFADVRGSTALAEGMNPSEFSRLMNRFFAAANQVLVNTDAIIDKLVGDEVVGFYIPGLAGPDHARLSVRAAQELLRVTGYADPAGPWIPIGVGVHTGIAFVGSIGSEGTFTDFTALGDNANIAARLASQARPGEALISEAAYAAAGLDLGNTEQRQLELKGKSEPVGVRVLSVGSRQ
jgi:adenylate cyclase